MGERRVNPFSRQRLITGAPSISRPLPKNASCTQLRAHPLPSSSHVTRARRNDFDSSIFVRLLGRQRECSAKTVNDRSLDGLLGTPGMPRLNSKVDMSLPLSGALRQSCNPRGRTCLRGWHAHPHTCGQVSITCDSFRFGSADSCEAFLRRPAADADPARPETLRAPSEPRMRCKAAVQRIPWTYHPPHMGHGGVSTPPRVSLGGKNKSLLSGAISLSGWVRSYDEKCGSA